MPRLIINGQEAEVPNGFTVLQATQLLGIEVPFFCYHPRLSIAGNCRMCLVQQEGIPKPIASCAMPAVEGMKIHTNTDFVKSARMAVLEFLLINHPLDCPICDQGGECDLQDITMAYGPSMSRFKLNKRAVAEKPMGPLIQTFMTRCIHCTRCIRFASEICGVRDLGAVGRGEEMEITAAIGKMIDSELSGNLADICPVGALTSKPYSYQGRPWDLGKVESIDVMDAVGSNIRVDTYAQCVVRILPRLNEAINEEWISDKTRYACDGLTVQRLDRPYIRKNGKLSEATWPEVLDTVANALTRVKGTNLAAIAGDLVSVEEMFLLKELMLALGSTHFDCRQDSAWFAKNNRSSTLFNTTIEGIDKADYCFVLHSDIRHEAPIIHARMRKRYLQGNFKVDYLGGCLPRQTQFAFDYVDHGNNLMTLEEILEGNHPISNNFRSSEKPMIIVGTSIFIHNDAKAACALLSKIVEKFQVVRGLWNGFNVLHRVASRVGGLEIGFVPQGNGLDVHGILESSREGSVKVIYLLGADEIDVSKLGNTFIIYHGHHGDRSAHMANVILPGAAYTEKNATYVNTEGRPQMTRQALSPPGQAKEDWKIIKSLANILKVNIPYENLSEIRSCMASVNPIFQNYDHILQSSWQPFGHEGPISHALLKPHDFSFYQTDPISRSSKTMAQCSLERRKRWEDDHKC